MTTFFKKQYFVLFVGLFVFVQRGYSQGQLVPLDGNDVIKKAYKQLPKPHKSNVFVYYEPVLLPFVDDFSDYTGYPDTALWIGRQTFVNQSFAVAPPTLGCVTLDAVDERGFVYAHAKKTPFPADTLLSRPIRLDSVFSPIPLPLAPLDSVYFSFFYQPGGGLGEPWKRLGDAPEAEDSLLLEFGYQTGNIVLLYYITNFQMIGDTIKPNDTIISMCNPDLFIIADDYYFPGDKVEVPCDSVNGMETIWERVWGDAGKTLEEFIKIHSDTFRQVMIPITDWKYFNRGFQFRFRNYASLEFSSVLAWGSNVDFWNIDYVRLDRFRSWSDTAIDDIAFVHNPGSILEKYTAMPWNQFKGHETAELRTHFTNYLTNLSNDKKNSKYRYNILDENKNVIGFHDAGNCNIESFPITRNYQLIDKGDGDTCLHPYPELDSKSIAFPAASSDSVTIYVQHIFEEEGGGDKNPKNDTAFYTQKFYNYYAYDDGTPEAGYIVTSSSNPYKKSLALEFTLNRPDTLRAIDIYFNHTWNDATFINFTLSVWKDNNGMPGGEWYANEVSQEYSADLYGFQRFHLTEPLPISGTFYIGYQIAGLNNLLNVGFDQNKDTSLHTFWRTNAGWYKEFLVGTPMLRPVVGREFPQVEVIEQTARFDMKIYPNPAKDLLYIDLPEEIKNRDITIAIYTVTGQKIYEQAYRSEIATAHFTPGLYLLQIVDNKSGIKSVRKFSIVK